MVHFGLYFIPAQSKYYEIGSRILGYDIRAGEPLPCYDFISPAWVHDARQYGFHITITDALEIETQKLPNVVREVTKVLACFPRNVRYIFEVEGVKFWNENRCVLELRPNRSIELLHDVLVSRINPLGLRSAYSTAYEQRALVSDSAAAAKIKLFYSPYIFDAFRPHFTYLYPFSGDLATQQKLVSRLTALLPKNDSLLFDRIALVVKFERDHYYRIYQEFTLS